MNINLAEIQGLKVLFFHLGTAPISFYRIVQFANEMRNIDGITPIYPEFNIKKCDHLIREYENNPENYISYLNQLFSIADVVVCQAVHSLKFLATLEMYKDMYKFKLVMESDDSPFHIDNDHPSAKNIGVGTDIEQTSYDQIKLSDAVIVSTDYLNNTFKNYKRNVYTIPNSIDFNIWNFSKKEFNKDKIILGWAGASGHQKDLSIVKPVLLQLLDKFPNLYLKCLHGAEYFIQHERYINDSTWSEIDKYPSKLHSMGFDIAIAPLWDNEFNRCKSNLRYLEYSALGIPCVASSVEPYKTTIQDGVDGFLAKNEKKWFDSISELIYNEDIRNSIGLNALNKVKTNFNLQITTQKYADILKEICNKKV
jgi:glycosyltransferase involved in cell wall biosynthesis